MSTDEHSRQPPPNLPLDKGEEPIANPLLQYAAAVQVVISGFLSVSALGCMNSATNYLRQIDSVVSGFVDSGEGP